MFACIHIAPSDLEMMYLWGGIINCRLRSYVVCLTRHGLLLESSRGSRGGCLSKSLGRHELRISQGIDAYQLRMLVLSAKSTLGNPRMEVDAAHSLKNTANGGTKLSKMIGSPRINFK